MYIKPFGIFFFAVTRFIKSNLFANFHIDLFQSFLNFYLIPGYCDKEITLDFTLTQSSEVEAVISGVQTMSIAETLELSGENSNDPDGNKAGDKVSYMWDIVNSDRSAVISRKSRKRLRFPKTAKLSLPGRGNLEAGKTYKFRLTYRVGKRVGITEHKVKVIECETCVPPVVSLLVIYYLLSK